MLRNKPASGREVGTPPASQPCTVVPYLVLFVGNSRPRQSEGTSALRHWRPPGSTGVSIPGGGESVSQSSLKDKTFSTSPDQNPPLELRPENEPGTHQCAPPRANQSGSLPKSLPPACGRVDRWLRSIARPFWSWQLQQIKQGCLREGRRFKRQCGLRPTPRLNETDRNRDFRVRDFLPVQPFAFRAAHRVQRHDRMAPPLLNKLGDRANRVDFKGDIQHDAKTRRFVFHERPNSMNRVRHDERNTGNI